MNEYKDPPNETKAIDTLPGKRTAFFIQTSKKEKEQHWHKLQLTFNAWGQNVRFRGGFVDLLMEEPLFRSPSFKEVELT